MAAHERANAMKCPTCARDVRQLVPIKGKPACESCVVLAFTRYVVKMEQQRRA